MMNLIEKIGEAVEQILPVIEKMIEPLAELLR